MKDVITAHLGTMSMTWPELQKRLRDTDLVRPDIKTKVCAVWDTVGSLGMPIAKSLLSKLSLNVIDDNPNPYSFVNTEVCDNIEHAFHAIALTSTEYISSRRSGSNRTSTSGHGP